MSKQGLFGVKELLDAGYLVQELREAGLQIEREEEPA